MIRISPLPAAVLFDLDGTLIDTEPMWSRAQRDLLQEGGAEWSPKFTNNLVGVSLLEGANYLREVGNLRSSPEEIVETMVQSVSAALATEEVRWRQGIKKLIRMLNTLNVPSALVTSSYRPIADAAAAAAPLGTFAAIVAGDEVTEPKPHPEAYLRAAELLQVPIRSALIIEDSPVGVASGLASGGITVAIPHEVEVEPHSELSRLRSAAEIDLSLLRLLRAGVVVDSVR